MKKLFVPLIGQYDSKGPQGLERPAIMAAFALAKRLDAHVSAVALIDPPAAERKAWPFWLPGGGASQLCDMIDDASAKRREHASTVYSSVLSEQEPMPLQTSEPTPGYSTQYSEVVGEIETTVGPLGRLADLALLSNPDTNWTEPFTPLVRACLADTGKPVMVIPQDASLTIGASIAIAWDGSENAARAISSALPLLRLANEITIFSAKESSKEDRNPNDVVEYLQWHGLSSSAEVVQSEASRPDQAVLDAAISREADLIILGARVHSRAHRLLFGSMTELVLDRPEIAAMLG